MLSNYLKRGGHRKAQYRASLLSAAAGGAIIVLSGRISAGQSMSPINVSGFTQDLIAETSPSVNTTTAALDAINNFVYYASGYPGTSSGGLPGNGAITSSYSSSSPTQFQLAPFTGNNALELSLNSAWSKAPYANSGTLTLATAQPYSTLAFLSSAANAPTSKTDLNVTYTLNFVGGGSATGTIVARDWDTSTNGNNEAIGGLTKISRNDEYMQPTVGMHEDDITIPAADQNLPLASVSFSSTGTDFSWAVYALSGLQNGSASFGTLVWNGNVNGNLDTTTGNFQGGVPYSPNNAIVFDDSATGTTNVSVVSNTNTRNVAFNNSSLVYNISGAALTVGGSLSFNGNQPVTFNNVLSVSGISMISGGGAVTFNNMFTTQGGLNISNGGPVVFNSPTTVAGGVSVGGNGTVSFSSTLSDTGSFTDNGNGNLSVSGTMSVSSGMFLAENAAAAFNGPVVVTAGGLSITANGPVTFNSSLGVVGAVVIASPAAVSVGGAFNSSGAVSVLGAGPVVFNNSVAVGGTFTANGGGAIAFNSSSSVSGAFNLNSGSVTVGTGGSIKIPSLSTSNFTTFTVLTGGTLTAANGTMPLTGTGTVNLVGPNNILQAGTGTAFNGVLTGAGGLNLSNGYVAVGAYSLALTGPINVGNSVTSTAYLLITDGSGAAGELPNGSPITVTIAGTGPMGTDNGYAGVIHDADNSGTSVFSGNIIIAPTGAYVSSGAGTQQGTELVLNGVISGTGPITFSTNADSLVTLNGTSNYTGETRLAGNTGAQALIDLDTLRIGVDNAISPASGVNFIGSAAELVLDLNGHHQTVAYLTGGNSTSFIYSQNGPGVLTVNTPAGTSASFAGIISDASGVSFIKTGPGTQTLGAANTYTQGTSVAGGTLVAGNSRALGSGPINMSGGTLLLPGGGGNVTGLSGFTLNGVNYTPTVSNGSLQITSTAANQATSAFIPEAVGFGGFTASFVYTGGVGSTATGATFTIQNDPRGIAALGSSGANLGYGGAITNSAAVEFNLSNGTVGFGTNGAIIDGTNPKTTRGATGPALGDPLSITLTYNASNQVLTEKIVDPLQNNATSTFTSSINLLSLLGGDTAYIGFTGGTGATGSNQNFSNFVFNNGGLFAAVNLGNSIFTAPNTSSVITAQKGGLTTLGPMSVAAQSTLKLTGDITTGVTGRMILTLPSLSIAGSTGGWTGKLDLTYTAMDLQNGTLADVTNQIRQGYNAGGAVWQGSGGITSSAAAADSTRLSALGVILNNDSGNQLYGFGTSLGAFDQLNPSVNDILVKYTYDGDSNLDGKVDGTDYGRIDNGFLTHLTGWYNGDFNYDGVVNGSDYTLIDNAYNRQGVSDAALLAGPNAAVTDQILGNTAVPEPTGMGLIVATAFCLSRRHRRRAVDD